MRLQGSKNFLLHPVKNIHAGTFTILFLQYTSSSYNIPGGGMIIFAFMLSNCFGLSGAIVFTSIILLLVWDPELMIPLTATSSVLNDASLKLSPYCFCEQQGCYLQFLSVISILLVITCSLEVISSN